MSDITIQTQLDELRKENDYWKQRCEAAEKIINRVNEDVYKSIEYHEWQQIKSQPPLG